MIYGCGGGGGATSTAVTPPPPPPPSCTATSLTSGSKLKISVKTNGIYLISAGVLSNFCLDSSNITLSSFKLQNWDPNLNSFVPIPVNFDPQGNLEFYGVGVNRNDYTAPNADYTETNVYWLVPEPPLHMSSKAAGSGGTPIPPMTTLHVENNKVYWPDMLNGAGMDHWFWERFLYLSSIYTFTVNNYDSTFTSTPITLSFAVTSQTATSPHSLTALVMNPTSNPTYTWADSLPHIFTNTITGSILNGNLSSLQFPAASSSDEFYFNWLELEYPAKADNNQIVFHGNFQGTGTFSINGFTQPTIELFDISDPKVPLTISNPSVVPSVSGYQLIFTDTLTVSVPNNYIALTPAQRKTPANITLANVVDSTQIPTGTNYLIISHENFLTNIQPLVNYRMTNGGLYTVHVAKIGDVYDSYSGGIFTPQAIKDFLKTANGSGVQYALLVGDASIDFKNYLGYGQENFVPTALIDYSFGQTVSDYWFVQNPNCNPGTVSTCNPIIALGRLPGKIGAEVDTMVNKIISYETVNKPPSPLWNKNALFVSGSDSSFDTDSNTLIGYLATNVFASTVFYSATPSGTTTAIENNINNGALITNYMGHGSVGFWANCISGACTSLFFQSSDIANLNNSTMLTFLVTLDCLNGMFAGYGEGQANPLTLQNNPYSVAETFFKSGTGGSVASFAPTGQGYTTNHMTLAKQLYQTLFGTGTISVKVPVIGNAIKQAETAVLGLPASSAQDLETARIFVLLGDPATQLALP